eukprot:UC1_evm7s1770
MSDNTATASNSSSRSGATAASIARPPVVLLSKQLMDTQVPSAMAAQKLRVRASASLAPGVVVLPGKTTVAFMIWGEIAPPDDYLARLASFVGSHKHHRVIVMGRGAVAPDAVWSHLLRNVQLWALQRGQNLGIHMACDARQACELMLNHHRVCQSQTQRIMAEKLARLGPYGRPSSLVRTQAMGATGLNDIEAEKVCGSWSELAACAKTLMVQNRTPPPGPVGTCLEFFMRASQR